MGNQLRINGLLQYIHLLLGLFVILWLNNGLLTFVTVYLSDGIKISVFFLWFAIACVMKKKYFSRYFVKAVLLIAFCIILLIINGTNTFIDVTYNFRTTTLFMAIFGILMFYYDSHMKYQKIIVTALIIDYIFIGINTFIKLQQIPNLSRYLSAGEDTIVSILGTTNYLGVGNYTYAYSMVMVGFMCAYNILNRKKYKMINALGYILLFIIILRMQFTIALLLLLAGTSYLVFIKVKRKKYMLFISVPVLFVLLLISIIALPNLMMGLGAFMPETIAVRFNDIANLFSGVQIQGSDLNLRLTLYTQSIEVFFNNILIGALSGKGIVGGHSTWFDFLGQMGIFSLPIFAFFIQCYRYIKKSTSENTLVLVNACFIFIFILGLINTVYNARILLTLIVFIPLITKVLSGKENVETKYQLDDKTITNRRVGLLYKKKPANNG